MRTANNNSNFTVEALVAKYRNYVNEHAPMDKEGDGIFSAPVELYADHQLLISLYKQIAGDKADSYILDGLSTYDKVFMNEALSKDELSFLCDKFKDTVEHIFSDRLFGLSEYDWNSIVSIKPDRIFVATIGNLIKEAQNNTVFIEDDLMGDVAMLYPQSIIVLHDSEEKWGSGFRTDKEENALKMIRFFASNIQWKVVKNLKNEKIDTIIRKIAGGSWKHYGIVTYSSVTPNGQMICYLQSEQLISGDWQKWRDSGVISKGIKTIIRYGSNKFIMLVEKCNHQSISMQDNLTGMVRDIPYDKVDGTILLPNYYLVDKPDNWIPLSDIADALEAPQTKFPEFPEILVKSTDKVLSRRDLGSSFKDSDISMKELYSVSDLTYFSEPVEIGLRDWYQSSVPCVFIWGFKNQYRVGYTREESNIEYALPGQMARLIPKDGIDIRYIAALLFLPEVKEQIENLYCGEKIVSYMPLLIRHIYVPCHTDMERASFLSETNYSAMENLSDDQKKAHEAYVKAIRLRKHALTQSLSSIESMFYALNNYRIKRGGRLYDEDVISRVKGTTVRNAFEFLSKSIEDMMPALEHIAEIEYSFAKPEWIDPETFIEEYINDNEKGWVNFVPLITWKKGDNKAKTNIYSDITGAAIYKKGDALNKFLFPQKALEKIFMNIISNAQSHGFIDKSRKDYIIKFSWRTDGMNIIVEIENNGTPIPKDQDTTSLLEYGVSTDLHHNGHNGIGCNEINEIMQRYDGKVEIVSAPDDEFPVKYILTFYHSYTELPL